MTTHKVKNDVVAYGVAYVAGLLALLLWPNRKSTDQVVVFFVSIAILILVGMAVDWLAFHWRPDLLGFLTLTGSAWRFRPLRYSFPNFLGFIKSFMLVQGLRSSGAADWGVTAYVVALPLLLVGLSASNLWWALASKSGSGDIPAR